MSYINQIVEDGVTYDIQAKALDSTLDATILKKSNLVNGFTQTTAGVNALDAAAGKTLNDNKLAKHVVVGAQPAGGGSATFTLTNSIGLLFGGRGSNYFAYLITVWDATARTLFSSGSSLPTIAHTSGSDTFTVTNNATTAMPMIFITRP